MINVASISGLADLAEASYRNFGEIPQGSPLEGAALAAVLEAASPTPWAEARVEEFIDHWRVAAHQPNTPSGFSATLFERLNPAPGESRYVVAVRGTEANIPSQIYADLAAADLADLVVNGLAWEQILDLYNWWQSISASTDSAYAVASSIPIPDLVAQSRIAAGYKDVVIEFGQACQIVRSQSVQHGLGLVDANQTVDVTGHSLGGYLATAFTRLFGAYAHVEHTSTFNSAGFAPGSEAVFAELQNLIGPGYGLGRFPNASEQTNYFAANGINVTTNSNAGNDVMRGGQVSRGACRALGRRTPIRTNNNVPRFGVGHGTPMGRLTNCCNQPKRRCIGRKSNNPGDVAWRA